jgi:cytochrome c-type biogenesis protein CcmH
VSRLPASRIVILSLRDNANPSSLGLAPTSMTRLFAWLAAALVLVASGHAGATTDAGARAQSMTASALSSAAPGEAIVEGRLLAPCCYKQTLDVHESPMATELRLEVRTRLAAGELPEAIEDDFVARYGEQVRAVPKGRDPRGSMFLVAIGVLVAAGIGLGLLVRRWRRTPLEAPRAVVVSGPRDAFDERIDADLRELDR